MKRLFVTLLSAALALSCLTACGGSNNGSNTGNNSSASNGGSSASNVELPELSGGFETPILITSAGKSADDVIIQTLCTKANITTDLNANATSADLDGVKTLILAVGGSSKGLGAAGIDADDEIARVQELISGAKAAGIKIVAMHVGGSARRGDLSDKFLADPFTSADAAIVVSSGDADGAIHGFLAQNNVPSAFVDGQVDCVACLTTLFG